MTSPGGSEHPKSLDVIATTTILADVARQVVGDAGEVTALLPVGADPHTFQPSARQMADVLEADIVVANGGGLEAGLDDALDDAVTAGVPVFTATDHIDTLGYEGDHDTDDHGAAQDHGHGEEDHGHADEEARTNASEGTGASAAPGGAEEHDDHADDAAVDPHFFLDPLRMADVALALGAELGDLAPDAGLAVNAESYAAELEAVHDRIAAELATVPEDARSIVTNHEAFAYFADRYGFDVVGTVVPSVSTGAEPSARDLEELAATIRQHDVPAIFVETSASDQLARTLAAEVGTEVDVVELHTGSLGEEGSDAASYVGLLETNATRIAEALGGT